ncbi:MBL fold metallo-hydrolase [bacterium]|nr:MBL fold metallo-hydrolase [bacterium]
MRLFLFLLVAIFILNHEVESAPATSPYLIVLGTAQDAGYPQAGCAKDCCKPAWRDASTRRFPTSIALVDPISKERWMFDCTPSFPFQLRLLDDIEKHESTPDLNGIFLTHAHIGHYTGLVHLGREVIGSKSVPVYAMPRMKSFLKQNGPWSQLLRLNNIDIRPLAADKSIRLNARLSVTPFLVPHRDEFSETVGFRIDGPEISVLFIPDIDKWGKWSRQIEDQLKQVDVAYLDGTFYAEGELPNRAMSEIPHPFIVESMKRFKKLHAIERNKVRFIHMNHTNPALRKNSKAHASIKKSGMHVAEQGEQLDLGSGEFLNR